MSRLLLILLPVVIAVGVAGGLFLGRGGSVDAGNGPPLAGEMREFELFDRPAPALRATRPDGVEVTLASYAGDVVLVNFWATWCAPCVAEMPSLNRLQTELAGEGLRVVPISIDRGGITDVEPFYRQARLDALGIYLDPLGAAPRDFEARGLPTTVLIDRDGRWVGSFAGAAEWDSPEAVALLRHYLAAEG